MTTMNSLLRGIITGLYVVSLFFESLTAGDSHELPLTVLALTASYGILMLLIWLYQRFPPAGPDSRAKS